LHCFIGQIEVQQSRSLAQQLQLPVSIWPLVIDATQSLFLAPSRVRRRDVPGGTQGRQGPGAAQTACDLSEGDSDEDADAEVWQREEEAAGDADGVPRQNVVDAEGSSAHEWCGMLEQCFRESGLPRDTAWSGLDGEGRGMCDCVSRMCVDGRRQVARRWDDAQILQKVVSIECACANAHERHAA